MIIANMSYIAIKGNGAVAVLLFFTMLVALCTSGDVKNQTVVLPYLPGTDDYLHGIIVLPRSQDTVNITLMDLTSNKPLALCMITKETDFWLERANCSLPTIKPGLAIVSSVQTTIMVYFDGNPLILPAIGELGNEYLLTFASVNKAKATVSKYFLYPSEFNMSLRVCLRDLDKGTGLMNNSSTLLHRTLQTHNCTNITLTNYEGLVLNDTTDLQEMEISANFPFGVLESYNGDTSRGRSGIRGPVDPQDQLSPIIRNIYPPLKAWGRNFLLPPRRDNRIHKLLVIPENRDANISIVTESGADNSLTYQHYDVTEITSSGWGFLNSSERVLVKYMRQIGDPICCWSWQYMFPIYPSENPHMSRVPSYQWINLLNEACLNLICENIVKNSTTIFDKEQRRQIPTTEHVSDPGYSTKNYNLSAGLYQVHFDTSCVLELFNFMNTTIIMMPLDAKSNSSVQTDSSKRHNMTNNRPSDGVSFIIKDNGNWSDSTDAGDGAAASHTDNPATSPLLDSHLLSSTDGNTTPSGIISDNSARQTTKYNATVANKDKSQVDKNNHKLPSESEKRATNLIDLPLTETAVRNLLIHDKNIENNLSAIVERSRLENGVNSTHEKQNQIAIQSTNRSRDYDSLLIRQMQQRNLKKDESVQHTNNYNQTNANTWTASLTTPLTSTTESDSIISPGKPTSISRHDTLHRQTADVNKPVLKNPHSDEYAVLQIIEPGGDQAGTESLHTENHVIINSQKHPGYVQKLDYDEYVETGNDKSLMAIIISLCTALVAVVGIIVIFMLIEFFSRRRQIRKTRIRPYVSYY